MNTSIDRENKRMRKALRQIIEDCKDLRRAQVAHEAERRTYKSLQVIAENALKPEASS